jgi:hypothetical protein
MNGVDIIGGIIIAIGLLGGIGSCMALSAMMRGSKADRQGKY